MASKWILLRGLTRGNGHWGDFPNLLRNLGYEIELMEIPGNGTQNEIITPTEVHSVIANIKKRSLLLRSNEKINICGISLGGMIALKWAEIYPSDLNSVVTVNTSLSQLSPFCERLKPRNYINIVKNIFASSVQKNEIRILEMTSNRADLIEKYAVIFSEFSHRHKVSAANLFRQLILANKIRIQKNTFKNVRVVYSEADRLVDSKCSIAIAAEFGYKSLSHPTAGHDLPLDEPEWLAEVISSMSFE